MVNKFESENALSSANTGQGNILVYNGSAPPLLKTGPPDN